MEELTIQQAERALAARYRFPAGCLRYPAGQRFWTVENGEYQLIVCDYRATAGRIACSVNTERGTLWRFNCR